LVGFDKGKEGFGLLFLLASNEGFVLPTWVNGVGGFVREKCFPVGDFTFSNGSCGETP
jgi:hypothetical protein